MRRLIVLVRRSLEQKLLELLVAAAAGTVQRRDAGLLHRSRGGLGQRSVNARTWCVETRRRGEGRDDPAGLGGFGAAVTLVDVEAGEAFELDADSRSGTEHEASLFAFRFASISGLSSSRSLVPSFQVHV
jgi:hypothetical protein